MTTLAIKYAFFAVIAILINLLTQYVSLLFYNGIFGLCLAIIFGTFAGLLTKYILDKNYIFYYQTKNKFYDFKKFVFYSAMGIITTIIFWGFEIGFDSFFKFNSAKYIGAIAGLVIGYVVKYNLDKKFVFRRYESHT
jgi:hypothetical protein